MLHHDCSCRVLYAGAGLGLVLGLGAAGVQAETMPRMSLAERPSLEVLADYGGEPARPYFVAIGMAEVPEAEGYAPDPRAPVKFGETDMLPVTSERLSPGEVRFRPLELPSRMTPFFLVGDDALSLRWLEARREVLRELNAVGLVIEVDTVEGLQRLREAAPGLELRPTPGDDLAGRLGLAHYPVLVTPQGLEQ
ncbi:integrating conjugative element protein [Halomonas sp. HK25]|uniref:integrating conjugative element protein n=1 Tax=Halomonas sp. HK25 TaxID=3394321 RepID=UPI0039FCE97E